MGQHRGRALLGIERREQVVSRRCGGGWRDRHRSMMAAAAYRPINDRLPAVLSHEVVAAVSWNAMESASW
jgi:hypothetical protein